MLKGTSIPVKWDTKRKLEQMKFDLETNLEKNLTWDDFLNEFVTVKDCSVKKEGKRKT